MWQTSPIRVDHIQSYSGSDSGKTSNHRDNMIAPLSFTPQSVAFAFAFYAWGFFCLFRKERALTDYKEIPSSIYYPLLLLVTGAILDNIRLLLGLMYGKGAASKVLAQIVHFAQVAVVPSLLATYTSMLVAMGMWSWLGTLGYIVSVPFVVNGLNNYVSEVHDDLEYTEDGEIPRYTLSKKKREQLGSTPMMIACRGALLVALVAWWVEGDIVPLLLQAIVLGGQAALPSIKPGFHIAVDNALELVFLAGLMRIQRYL